MTTSSWIFEDVNMFKLLCPHKFKRYKSLHKPIRFSKNAHIYCSDDNADNIFIIERGKVKIGYYNEQGDEIIKAIISKGELFGEKALLGELKREEFAIAQTSGTTLCTVPVCKVRDLMRGDQTFSQRIYKFLGFKFKRLESRLDLLLCKDTRQRLELFLDELAKDYGHCCPETGFTIIEHPYTQKDIAGLIATSRPTLNNLLNELKAEGAIDFVRNKIRLKYVNFMPDN